MLMISDAFFDYAMHFSLSILRRRRHFLFSDTPLPFAALFMLRAYDYFRRRAFAYAT